MDNPKKEKVVLSNGREIPACRFTFAMDGRDVPESVFRGTKVEPGLGQRESCELSYLERGTDG